MPYADFCPAVRRPFDHLSRRGDAEQISWGKLNRLPCTIAESTLRVLDGYGLRGKLPARPALAPCIRFLFIDSHVCSMLPSDPPRAGSPCIITRPYLHQVGQRTFTSKLLSMPSTQRSRSRGGRCRVGEASSSDTFRQINCGSQGGSCDPSTQNHAGGTPASQLL